MKPEPTAQQPCEPDDLWVLVRATLKEQIDRIRSGRLALWIPQCTLLFRSFPARTKHCHHYPELFIQCSGRSLMELPTQTVRTDPGQILLVPRGVSHWERADPAAGPFCSLVCMYGDRHLTIHAGRAATGSAIAVDHTLRLAADNGSQLYGLLNEACELAAAGRPSGHPAIAGLLLAHLGLLEERCSGRAAPGIVSGLTAQASRLVRMDLSSPDLSVNRIAAAIRCSPSYLSHLFRRDTGTPLASYINQERIGMARHLLLHTAMTVGEVADACGYRDPAYFSRRFARTEGSPPREFRRAHRARG